MDLEKKKKKKGYCVEQGWSRDVANILLLVTVVPIVNFKAYIFCRTETSNRSLCIIINVKGGVSDSG